MIDESYAIPVDKTGWKLSDGTGDVRFTWSYGHGREKLLNLYAKGKRRQWDTEFRIDWDHEIDTDDPMGAPDELIPIFGSDMWNKLSDEQKGVVRRHMVAWQFSQFLHGEQGALVCTAKIVQSVPDIESKYYAATQVMDEARHVETYSRYLDKLDLAYPINPNLQAILDNILTDSRWDMTYLGMQVLIEGLALAAFGGIRQFATDPLARSLNAYVMQDEARHVMFGRLALRDYYPHLSSAEIAEREEFTTEACWAMRDRFLAEEVWRTLDLDTETCIEYVKNSEAQALFRSRLFERIVPTLRDIGLWGDKVRTAFDQMGVMVHADADVEGLMEEDERIAEEIEAEIKAMKASREAQVGATIAAGVE